MENESARLSSPLFCKPPSSEKNRLFEMYVPLLGSSVAFTSVDLEEHLPVFHRWVNLPYAETFWQMRGSMGLFRSCYQCVQQNPYAHSFAGFFGRELACQLDVYKVAADELAGHIEHTEHDCGFHLLMAPNSVTVHGLTVSMVKTFLSYYFSFAEAETMYAEPDIQNAKSVRVLERLGFTQLKTITMSYKTATLFRLNKTNFL